MEDAEDFEPRLGRIRDGGSKHRDRFFNHVLRASILAGAGRALGSSRRGFDGSRIGRGAGVGRMLGAAPGKFDPATRRVVVKISIVRLGAQGLSRASAHLRYLQRDGTTRDGDRGSLYSAELDEADGESFLERGQDDRHQFRFIVAPEDGSEYEDLRPLVRRLMEQASQDLGTKLDWVAVDHFNTGHAHSHVIVRGRDDLGKDLVIARDYISRGLRERAIDLVNLDLGPRTALEIAHTNAREIEQERFTPLDRRILAGRDETGLADPRHRSRQEQDLRVARLRQLARLGLAEEMGSGRWRLHDELEPALRRMGERGDIIRTLNRELRGALPERAPQDHAIYDPRMGERLVGRLVMSGLADEHADRRYLILDATDGRSHYIDVGVGEVDAKPGAILSVAARPIEVRQVDRTIAEVAAANGGRYSVNLHLLHDPTASEAFAEAHVRRLEAMRRSTGGAARDPDGAWHIASDHLARAREYERRLTSRIPVRIETLSARALRDLPRHDGATWLDRELVSERPAQLERGFGVEVRKALAQRRQWLIAQRLIELDSVTAGRGDVVAALRRREFTRVAAALSKELGRTFAEAAAGEKIEGRLVRAVVLGDEKFALIEKSREFTLVPWRAVLDRQVGRRVSGIMRDSGVSWTVGQSRGQSR